MLAEMRIQGLGVIDDATLDLDPGLTVLTGETGAGKTMVVTGLTLLGGGRAEASRVADGARRAVVEGRFSAEPAAVAVADEVGADPDEDGTLIAVRTVGADGRSRAHLGGRSVPVGVLGRLAEATLAVHGQNDQLRLLRPAEQRALLDRFAGETVAEPLARYRAVRSEWMRISAELVERRDGARRLAQEADLLRHGLTEITAVDPQPGEDVELVAHARRLAEADELRAVASAAQAALVGAEDVPDVPAALALIGEARHRLAAAGDAELSALDARLAEALALLGDVGAELTGYLDRLDADPERLASVLSRQAELKALTRKYAPTSMVCWRGRLPRGSDWVRWTSPTRPSPDSPPGATGSPSSWPSTRPPLPPPAPRPRVGWPPIPPPSSPGSRWPTPACSSRSRSGRPGRGLRRPCASVVASWQPGRTESTRSSCASSPTQAPRRSRCTRARPAASCRG